MKKLITSAILLAGSTPAMAHTLSFQEGAAALYHQVLGSHHLPFTLLLVVIGVVAFRLLRKSRQ
jgi:hypothetical protein